MTTATLRADATPVVDLSFALALGAAVLFAFAAPLAGMLALWNVSPMYSHGYIVPLVSVYLLHARRDAFRRLRPAPARLGGGLLIAAAAALLVGGDAAGIQAIQQIGFLVAIAGAVLLLFGWPVLRTALPGIAYLLLMVPIWDGLTEPLHHGFQLRSAALAVALLRPLGIPAHLDGVYVDLPNLTLEVARTCSGVNYLVAVMALGLPLSYLYLSSTWRRVLLVGGSMAIAALSNGLRVALIGVLAYLGVGSPLHGPFHVLHGLFVAGIGYVVLFVGVRLLADQPAEEPAAGPPAPAVWWRVPRLEWLALTVVFVALGSGVLAREEAPVPLPTALASMPESLGEWHSDTASAEPGATEWWTAADAHLRRRYRTNDGASVIVYVEYYESQRQGREIAGYKVTDLHRRSTPIAVAGGEGPAFDANLVRTTSGETQAVFWYEVDRPLTTAMGAKARTLWTTLAYGRSNGAALMILVDPLGTGPRPTTGQLQALGLHLRSAFTRLTAGQAGGQAPS